MISSMCKGLYIAKIVGIHPSGGNFILKAFIIAVTVTTGMDPALWLYIAWSDEGKGTTRRGMY